MNVLLDEMIPPRETWSIAPRYVSFALTNACELTCSFCYAAKAPARLDFEEVVRWAKEIDQAGCFGVGFGGGEPTLHPRYSELCRAVHDQTSLAVTMTTHGHQFTDKLSDELAGNVDFIRLSMDGVGATYERLRGRPFSAFKEKLALVRRTSKFGINYVVNENTINDLPAASEFVFAQGADQFLLLPELVSGGGPRVNAELLDRLADWITTNYRRYRLATSQQGASLMKVPILPIMDGEDSVHDFAHVDAFGVLKRSAFDSSGIRLTNDVPILDAIGKLAGRPISV